MRVALDGAPLTVATGGIRQYTEELHRALCQEFPQDAFELVAPEPGRWWSIGLPRVLRRRGIDLFHGTDFAVPYWPSRPSVMTLHDLSPWKDRAWRAASDRVRRRTPWLLRLGLATMVATPTEAIRREAIARFGLRPDRVAAVPLAASERFRPGAARGGYLLRVGTIEPRKNVQLAIGAVRELRRAGGEVTLKLAGRNEMGLKPEPGIEVLGPVPGDALPGLYAGAAALLFPSLYEGFGLPVLEAFRCGVPVVASRDPALMEVSGGAALHPASDSEWPAAIRAAIDGPEWRERALARGAEFTWSRTARRMREVYREAIRLHAECYHPFSK